VTVTAYIGIGANLGAAAAQVEAAIAALAGMPATSLSARSCLYASAPVDADGDDYVNAVARLATTLAATDLLLALQEIEHAAGRERRYRNAPRTLDLDLLIYGDEKIAIDHLTVPHPRMMQRAFVLLPLLEIDPSIVIPGHGPANAFLPAVADQAIRKL
jgi:2-amino-4-hydroxy-6-hydroxymethyldihydropteridine diphosphokinase